MEESTNGTAPAIEETPIEAPTDALEAEVIETPAEEVVVETTEATPADETPTETPAEETEETPELVSFDIELPTTELIEKGKAEVFEKYEVPAPVQAYIEALEQKAQVQPLGGFSEYGEESEIKTLLDRQSYLTTARPEGDSYRPNTDLFVADFVKADRPELDRTGWLIADLLRLPSARYNGQINRFEEFIADAFGSETEPIAVTLNKYHQFREAFEKNALPTNDVPEFIPRNLHEAYFRLPRATRDELSQYIDDPTVNISYAQERAQKLEELALIQKGLDGDRLMQQHQQQQQEYARQTFETTATEIQTKFYGALREEVTKDLNEKVKFSEDPNVQAFEVGRTIALFTQALDDGIPGTAARKALEVAGIPFDYNQAANLLRKIDQASVDVTSHQLAVDDEGRPLDPVALKKAQKDFESASKDILKLAQTVIDATAKFATTGKAEDVKKAAEKIKIPEKARIIPKGNAATARAPQELRPPSNILPGTYEWDKWWARKTLEEKAMRQRAQANAMGMKA